MSVWFPTIIVTLTGVASGPRPFPGLYHPPCASPVVRLPDKQRLPNPSGLAVLSVFGYMGHCSKEGQTFQVLEYNVRAEGCFAVSYILGSMNTPVYLPGHMPVQSSYLLC